MRCLRQIGAGSPVAGWRQGTWVPVNNIQHTLISCTPSGEDRRPGHGAPEAWLPWPASACTAHIDIYRLGMRAYARRTKRPRQQQQWELFCITGSGSCSNSSGSCLRILIQAAKALSHRQRFGYNKAPALPSLKRDSASRLSLGHRCPLFMSVCVGGGGSGWPHGARFSRTPPHVYRIQS